MTSAPHIFLVAGESSGDQLGAELMQALIQKTESAIKFSGVGGPLMQAQGLETLFPASEISLIGPSAIFAQLPLLLRRLRETVRAVIEARPDILVIIDSPEFTQRVAKKVRQLAPSIPIVKYVAPQVWAWRPKRAARMRAYIDEILALFPFEPEYYARLNGPKTTYVGHPLLDRKDLYELRPEDQQERASSVPVIAVLPGSRSNEVKRLIEPFGQALALLKHDHNFQVSIPVVPHLRDMVEKSTRNWAMPVILVEGMQAKWALFRRARAALAASGTVTLELALAHVPMIAAYKVEPWMEPILRQLIHAPSIVLPNLILKENVVPEFYQKDVSADKLTLQLINLLKNSPAREKQLSSFKKLYDLMRLPNHNSPAMAAAERVLAMIDLHSRYLW